MKPEELLEKVKDRKSFLEFVKALAAEREDAERLEKERPEYYIVDGAHNWKNADIASFLTQRLTTLKKSHCTSRKMSRAGKCLRGSYIVEK